MASEFEATPFYGTLWTHEVVVEGQRKALAGSLAEALVVARALSRVTHWSTEVRVYKAYSQLPHTSFRAGEQVR